MLHSDLNKLQADPEVHFCSIVKTLGCIYVDVPMAS